MGTLSLLLEAMRAVYSRPSAKKIYLTLLALHHLWICIRRTYFSNSPNGSETAFRYENLFPFGNEICDSTCSLCGLRFVQN